MMSAMLSSTSSRAVVQVKVRIYTVVRCVVFLFVSCAWVWVRGCGCARGCAWARVGVGSSSRGDGVDVVDGWTMRARGRRERRSWRARDGWMRVVCFRARAGARRVGTGGARKARARVDWCARGVSWVKP